MKRFKHVLATTDLSPGSFAAVSYAAHVAKSDGAVLTILHVPHSTSLAYTDFVPPIDTRRIDSAIEEAARARLENWCRKHVHGRSAPNVHVILRRGITHEAICSQARDSGASVIVMATHGRKGVRHAVIGSVTERVLREAPCPVLVVRPPSTKKRIAERRGSRRSKRK